MSAKTSARENFKVVEFLLTLPPIIQNPLYREAEKRRISFECVCVKVESVENEEFVLRPAGLHLLLRPGGPDWRRQVSKCLSALLCLFVCLQVEEK